MTDKLKLIFKKVTHEHPAVEDLLNSTAPDQHEVILAWATKWIHFVESEQSVVSRKYMSAEYEDEIKLRLAQNIAEEVAETSTMYKVTDKNVKAIFATLKRKP